jgi:two-component system OmpR family response regulator
MVISRNERVTHPGQPEPTPTSEPDRTHPHTVLVVDDDPEICALVADHLQRSGYAAVTACDGPTMLAALDARPVELIILDLNLPGEDGLSLCRETRSRRNIPIIMLTARGEAVDRVIGLEVGADDYLTKPFDPRELTARVRSVMRRAYSPLKPLEPPPPKRAIFRDWTLDFESRRLIKGSNRVVILSGSEYSLLKFFVEHANEVLLRDQILTLTTTVAPQETGYSAQRIADLQISRLRHKLSDNARAPDLIMTVRGQGYVFATAVTFE